MKPNAFLTIYNARTKHIQPLDENTIVETITDLIKPEKYIPFDTKLELVKKTIEQSADAEFVTAERYRNLIINMIALYTNLEMDKKGFDILSESKTLDIILSTFKSEYQICSSLMQMCLQDMEGK